MALTHFDRPSLEQLPMLLDGPNTLALPLFSDFSFVLTHLLSNGNDGAYTAKQEGTSVLYTACGSSA